MVLYFVAEPYFYLTSFSISGRLSGVKDFVISFVFCMFLIEITTVKFGVDLLWEKKKNVCSLNLM